LYFLTDSGSTSRRALPRAIQQNQRGGDPRSGKVPHTDGELFTPANRRAPIALASGFATGIDLTISDDFF
jgi:hypothetical protein